MHGLRSVRITAALMNIHGFSISQQLTLSNVQFYDCKLAAYSSVNHDVWFRSSELHALIMKQGLLDANQFTFKTVTLEMHTWRDTESGSSSARIAAVRTMAELILHVPGCSCMLILLT
jgi:hypothetical protein